MTDFEKLGVFYLGHAVDAATKKPVDSLLLYQSKDLLTHAVCVGMTGSGKTGLCVGLLEEAAIDGIPAIVIDPKGDIANLLLTFPELSAAEFRPWVQEDEVQAKGISADEFAQQQAELWKKGIASFGQDGERIGRLKEAAEFSIYTPGSKAGLSMSVLGSFDAPPQAVVEDEEVLQDRIDGTVTSLLGLLGIESDPLQSREHILLANIFSAAWRTGKNLDLAGLIGQIQKPPFQKAGVLDLETFYPAKERFQLATALNGLVASPSFKGWLEGDPLDIKKLLRTEAGKPRISILSIAHLSDQERMFFVSLVLNQLLSWVRTQSGTTSLRALFYMDEIFGYFPPVANPPSKKPLLTLLKQARAYGLGLVLATQNPVDLDYKGLSNTGTWFIGRLQTERDKMRVLDGLEGAAAQANSQFDRQSLSEILAGLGSRVFLLNNVHEDAPQLFTTRWTLCYLRGPMTREQIKTLMDPQRRQSPPVPVKESAPSSTAGTDVVPVLPPGISTYYLPVQRAGDVTYRPAVLGAARLNYMDDKLSVCETRDVLFTTPLSDAVVPCDWQLAEAAVVSLDELEHEPEGGAVFAALPSAASNARNYAAWSKLFVNWLYQTQQLELLKSAGLDETSQPNESERDFRTRLDQAAREKRDEIAAKLTAQYAPKFATLADQKRRAEQRVEQQKSQQGQAILQTALSVGTGLLGAFLGRKVLSATNVSKVATAARQAGRSWQESQQVGEASLNVETVNQRIAELQAKFDAELTAQQGKADPATEVFEKISIRLKKTNIEVRAVALGWKPE